MCVTPTQCECPACVAGRGMAAIREDRLIPELKATAEEWRQVGEKLNAAIDRLEHFLSRFGGQG